MTFWLIFQLSNKILWIFSRSMGIILDMARMSTFRKNMLSKTMKIILLFRCCWIWIVAPKWVRPSEMQTLEEPRTSENLQLTSLKILEESSGKYAVCWPRASASKRRNMPIQMSIAHRDRQENNWWWLHFLVTSILNWRKVGQNYVTKSRQINNRFLVLN